MVADQLHKRSKVSNVIHSSSEMQKTKKKKFSHHGLNTKSRISLEWDGKNEQVVSKKEQISIARRELIPFLPFDSNYPRVLGDVFEAPLELFDLENLTGLLSYEVWETHLSLQERDFLTQFLPEGSDPRKAVYELLAGNNLCFGNSFSKWGASVCSGGCHPDAILRQEQRNKANKISYFSEMHDYHTKMIGTLQLWKEKWASCVDPENDFMQKLLSSREGLNKRGPLNENRMQYGLDEVDATSGSCSWDDNKLYNSDSPNFAIANGETVTRVSRVDTGNKNYDSAGTRLVARPKKGDQLRGLNVECGDGAKYMSYIKVSKEQHERVKSSMRHSKISIQPRSLNHVLGNLDGFCVQPYEVFEKEEKQKLHDHWSHLAKKDLHVGFENWKSFRSAKSQVTKSLLKELEDKWKLNDQPDSNFNNQYEENSGFIRMELNDDSVFVSDDDLNAENQETSVQIEHRKESSQDTAHNQHLLHNNNNNNNNNNTQNFCHMAMDANNEALTESNVFPSNVVEYTENINHVDEPQFRLPSAASEIWDPVSLPPSGYLNRDTSVGHEYSSIGALSTRQAQSSFLHRRSDGGDSFYNPYVNQDRNELLLDPFLKDPVSALSRPVFHPTDTLLGPGQFPRNLCSSLPLVTNIEENIFADGSGGFSLPRQQQNMLPFNHVQDWSVNNVNLPTPSSSSSSHHQLSQNWFSNDEVAVRDGWHSGIGNSGNQVADESLYGVLSQFNGLRSGVEMSSSAAMEQRVLGRRQILPVTANVVPPGPARRLGLNYLSGNEGQLGWINVPSTMQETGLKPFPRLWNDKDLGRR